MKTGVYDDEVDLDEFKPKDLVDEYQYNPTKLVQWLEREILNYKKHKPLNWNTKIVEFILLQFDPLKISNEEKEEVIFQVESLKQNIDKQESKGFISKWIANITNFVMRRKSEHNKTLDSIGKKLIDKDLNGAHDLKNTGEIFLKEMKRYDLLDNLLDPKKIDKLESEDLKALYYLSIRNFSRGTPSERNALDKIENFDNGSELCTREEILNSLKKMISKRKELGQEITSREVLELKIAKSESRLVDYENRLDIFNKDNLSMENSDNKRIMAEIKAISDAYHSAYNGSYLVQDLAGDLTIMAGNESNNLKPKLLLSYQNEQNFTNRFNLDLLNELSKHSELIAKLNNNKYQEFKDNLYDQLKSKKGISLSYSVKEAFLSVGVVMPEVSKAVTDEQKMKKLVELHGIVPFAVATKKNSQHTMPHRHKHSHKTKSRH